MRVSRIVCALRSTACTRSTTFFELYGRAPDTEHGATKDTPAPAALSCSTVGSDGLWDSCQALLQRFHAQNYASPGGVPADLTRDALASIKAVLTGSPRRRAAAARTLWERALELHAHVAAPCAATAADTATILLVSRQAVRANELCAALLCDSAFLHHLRTLSELPPVLRFLSACVVSAAAGDALPLSADLCELLESSLAAARRAVAAADKPQRAALAHEVEVLAWAMDWCYGARTDFAPAESVRRLRPLLPQWLVGLFDPVDSAAAAAPSGVAYGQLSPRWLLRLAQLAVEQHDPRSLERLLQHAERTEATTASYRLFDLSPQLASMLVARFPHLPASARAAGVYGTALRCDALWPFSSTSDAGFEAAVGVLTSMAGPEPYAVLRGVVRHQPADALAALQERTGDVLTGEPQLNWRTALAFTMGQVERADPHWRVYLPETLRLLSDTGRASQFWTLLSEYDAKDATSSLSVAASLGRAVLQSGRWWHAMEVLDLVAAAPPPRTAAERHFLASACADTLRALVQSRRWQESLALLEAVGDAVPPQETAAVAQLLTSLPAGAPWAAALRLAEQKGFAVHNTAALLAVMHDGAATPLDLSRGQQRAALAVFAQHGRHDLTRLLVAQSPSDLHLWRVHLQALERSPDAVDEREGEALLASMPPEAAGELRTFSAVAQVCLQHGWLSVLDTHLAAAAASADTTLSTASREYRYLLTYLRSGERPPLTYAFYDSRIVHQFIACVAARQLSVLAALPRPASVSKRAASVYLRVPLENIGTLRGPRGSDGPSVRVYTAAASAFLPEHVLHRGSDGLVVGYKVPGASLFASARGLLELLADPGVYVPVYNMSAASSGLFVLCPATTPLRRYAFRLVVRVCLAVLPGVPPLPLLSASFYRRYEMRWCAGADGRHEVEATVEAESGLAARSALRVLKHDINAEGWGLVETEAGSGDLYHVRQLSHASRCPRGGWDWHHVQCGSRQLQPISVDAEPASWTMEM